MNQTFYGCASITNSQRVQIMNKQGLPGPGTYDPLKQDQSRIPHWTLKPKIQYTSCFHDFKKYVPAPNSYQIGFSKNDSSKKRRQIDLKNQKYKDRNYVQKSSPIIALQIPSFIQENSGYSFGYRDQKIIKQHSPGPVYHVGKTEEDRRSRKKLNSSSGFGFGQRNINKKYQTPGPGNYNPSPEKNYASSGKWTFPKGRKKQDCVNTNPTGPGQYSPQMFNTSRSFKLKGRYNQIKNEQSTACPGSYQLPDTKNKRSAVFKAQTNQNKQNQIDNGPSPFSYNPPISSLKKSGYSLGKKLYQFDQNIQNPGPGSYQLQQSHFTKAGGYMSRKIQQKKKGNLTQDNFYKYNPKNQATSYKFPQFSFRQSANNYAKKSFNLGPGSYNINQSCLGQSYSIGKYRRFKPLSKEKPYGNALNQKSYYSTIGYLPEYLKDNKSQGKQYKLIGKINEKQNQNYEQSKQNC